LRNGIYFLRLLTGLAMLASSLDWFLAALRIEDRKKTEGVTPSERRKAA
jgi:hypothetical protein